MLLAVGWLVLVRAVVFAVGVRTARISFSAIGIYLYADGVLRDCGAFSCSCVWCVGVVVYICIYVSI